MKICHLAPWSWTGLVTCFGQKNAVEWDLMRLDLKRPHMPFKRKRSQISLAGPSILQPSKSLNWLQPKGLPDANKTAHTMWTTYFFREECYPRGGRYGSTFPSLFARPLLTPIRKWFLSGQEPGLSKPRPRLHPLLDRSPLPGLGNTCAVNAAGRRWLHQRGHSGFRIHKNGLKFHS